MPELPEIETVKLQLQKVLLQCSVLSVSVLSKMTVKGDINSIIGKKVVGIERKGKVLLIDFADNIKLGFHFKMTGQLIYVPNNSPLHPSLNLREGNLGDVTNGRIVGGHPTQDFSGELPSKHTRVIFTFTKPQNSPLPPSLTKEGANLSKLYFNDQRKFGWIEINPKFVDSLGPEPFEIDEDKFLKLFRTLKRPIKVAIMDQKLISGVGNIYANDALWESKINPTLLSAQCSETQLRKLFEAIKLVLREGIKYGGASAVDKKYVNLNGLGGHYQDHFRVYEQDGKPCKRCGEKIVKITLGGRGTYFCPQCQK